MKKIPILILHGWRVPVERYFPLENLFLKAGFKVFVPQLPGFETDKKHTGSDRMGSPGVERIRKSIVRGYTLDNYIDFVINFLKQKKIDKVFLVGHSFGGRVAIKLSTLHPEKVKALLLTGVPAIRDKNLKRTIFLILAKLGKAACTIPPFCLLKQGARKILYGVAGEWNYYQTNGVLKQTFKKIVNENLEPLLSKIKIPTLLLWGEKDQIVPVSIAQKIFAKIPKTDLIIISNTSHKLPYENPNLFSKKCLEFLDVFLE